MVTQLIAKDFPPLLHAFFCRPAEVVGPDLVDCRLVKRLDNGSLLWGVIVETEAYSQEEPACHGYRRRSPSNDWWRQEVLIKAVESVSHQGSRNCLLRLICGSIKSQSIGIRWW